MIREYNMKTLTQTILILAVSISTSSAALASGNHSGGHHGEEKPASHQAHWMSPKAAANQKNPVAATPESLKKGATIYQNNCASCHGATGKGDGVAGKMLNPKPADLVTMAGGHPDGDYAYKIREGRGAMPAWKNVLNEEQVWHVVNYIQRLNGDTAIKKASGLHSGGHGAPEHHN